eukprot:m.174932 g.174932  ORF g.174932 m.174932 type:complete len:57 (-) comp14885_c1_seq1:4327-4497(-)
MYSLHDDVKCCNLSCAEKFQPSQLGIGVLIEQLLTGLGNCSDVLKPVLDPRTSAMR